MSKFLRQKWSGHIFPWTERLAERPDMEPYEPPAAPAPAPETPTQNPGQKPTLPPLDDALETFRKGLEGPTRKLKAGKA